MMNNDSITPQDIPSEQPIEEKPEKKPFIERLIRKNYYSYIYMVSLLVYLLVCGYVLIFSGSLFFEAITKGGWRPEASDYDSTSLFLGYLFGFPSLMGVIGGITVLATRPEKMFRFKVLFFVPAVVWSLLLVLDILRRPLSAWIHGLYLLPAFLICCFVLFNVIKRVTLPYHGN